MKKLIVLFALLVSLLAPTLAYASSDSLQVKTIPGPSVSEVVENRLHSSLPWYAIRASGIIAAASLVILLLSGIGQITGHTYRFLPPLTAWASHRSLGIIFGLSVSVHMIGLLLDHFAPFSAPELLVPWLSSYKPVTLFGLQLGSLWVALGVLSFWGTALVVITSLRWVEKRPKAWKRLHFISYIVMAMVFAHALFLGTDLGNGWPSLIWIGLGLAVLVASVVRAWRLRTT